MQFVIAPLGVAVSWKMRLRELLCTWSYPRLDANRGRRKHDRDNLREKQSFILVAVEDSLYRKAVNVFYIVSYEITFFFIFPRYMVN